MSGVGRITYEMNSLWIMHGTILIFQNMISVLHLCYDQFIIIIS